MENLHFSSENSENSHSVWGKITNVCGGIRDGIYDLCKAIQTKLLKLRQSVATSWDKLSLQRQKELITQIAVLSLMFIAFICFCCGNLPAGCAFACLALTVPPVKWIIDTFKN